MAQTNVNWFEIPVADINRAADFYQTVLGIELGEIDGPDGPMKVFAGNEGPAGTLSSTLEASPAGVQIYLNCPDIDAAMARVEGAGGSVVQTKTSIGPFGFVATFTDTEGNQVSVHHDT